MVKAVIELAGMKVHGIISGKLAQAGLFHQVRKGGRVIRVPIDGNGEAFFNLGLKHEIQTGRGSSLKAIKALVKEAKVPITHQVRVAPNAFFLRSAWKEPSKRGLKKFAGLLKRGPAAGFLPSGLVEEMTGGKTKRESVGKMLYFAKKARVARDVSPTTDFRAVDIRISRKK